MGIFGSRTKPEREPGPLLRATVESGAVVDDPSEDALFALLEHMERGEEDYLIVERTSDSTQQTYAQVAPEGNGEYVVEHRDGSPERHFATHVADMRSAHELLTGWAFDVPDWDAGVEWTAGSF